MCPHHYLLRKHYLSEGVSSLFQKLGKYFQCRNFCWVTLNLINFIYFEKTSQFDYFYGSIVIKILIVRVSVTAEPHHSLLKAHYHKIFENIGHTFSMISIYLVLSSNLKLFLNNLKRILNISLIKFWKFLPFFFLLS